MKCKEYIEKNCLDFNSYEYNRLFSKYPVLENSFTEKWMKIVNSLDEVIGVEYQRKYNNTITISFRISMETNYRDLYSLNVYASKIFKDKRNILTYTFSDLNERNAFGNFLPGTLSNAIAYMIYPELAKEIKKEEINLDALIKKYISETNEQ